MKFRWISLSAAFCAGTLVAADVPPTSAAKPAAVTPITVEEIVAKVNGDIITRSELERSRRQLEDGLKQRNLQPDELERTRAEVEKNILRDKIDQLLLIQRGRELDINVDPEVSKYLADIQLRTKVADPEKFQQMVKEQTGQSYEDYKAEVRNGMLTQRVLRQEVGGRIPVPRADIEKYYNEHKSEFVRQDEVFLREILVSTENKDDAGVAAAEKKAKDIVARARKGERFGDMARQVSEAVTARSDGELGAFKRGELNKQIEDIVFAQERGYVTDPIRVQNGYLILKVEERFRPGQATLEEVEQQIVDRLYRPKFEPMAREYLTKLRAGAFLEIKSGYADSGAAPGKTTDWSDPAQLRPETVTKEEVAASVRRKRLLWLVPVPGTATAAREGTSSSR